MKWGPNEDTANGGADVSVTQISAIWTAIIYELNTAGVDINNNKLWFEISNEPNGITATEAYD